MEPGTFHPSMVEDQPEIAHRYFDHAIALGTPLRTTVELDVRGTFLLGDKNRHWTYRMTARQILAPPDAFVWVPRMSSGLFANDWRKAKRSLLVQISGSDALESGTAWTRFWMMGLIPVANERSSPDLVRSAAFRSAMEAIWSLLGRSFPRIPFSGKHGLAVILELGAKLAFLVLGDLEAVSQVLPSF